MKTVVEVTDMKTVQKLANIVRLWYFFLESLYLVCADPSQTAEIAKHAERAGLVSENASRKMEKWMLGSENWTCWFPKTNMLMSANGHVARREHPNFGCFNPTALNLWRLHLFRLNWDWT